MRALAIVLAMAGMALVGAACAAPTAAVPSPGFAGPGGGGGGGAGETSRTFRVGAVGAGSGDVPERDPAARGQLAVDMSRADLPDDRDGDGVDQLDLCPELPPDRVDGCPHAR